MIGSVLRSLHLICAKSTQGRKKPNDKRAFHVSERQPQDSGSECTLDGQYSIQVKREPMVKKSAGTWEELVDCLRRQVQAHNRETRTQQISFHRSEDRIVIRRDLPPAFVLTVQPQRSANQITFYQRVVLDQFDIFPP